MRGINKVTLVGNLGQEPEIRYLPNGNPVANFSVATSEQWKDKETGEKKEKTEWHRIVIWGKLAEVVGQYVKKGSRLYLEGKLQTRKYQDKDGHDRYITEIVCDQMLMLDGKNGGGQDQHENAPARSAKPASTAQSANGGGDFSDDIPFAGLGREYFA